MAKIRFSVVSYFPSVVTNENVNVGIVFHILDTNRRVFHVMKNWNRLESFDDELDISFMKSYLNGIKKEVENNLFNYEDDFELQEYRKFYVNDIRFSSIKEVEVSDVEGFITNTSKVYMRLDFEKCERISHKNQMNYMKKFMKSIDLAYSSKKIAGKYDESVTYDYTIGDVGFKSFEFESKEINRLIANAKAWSHTANSLKPRYKTVFVYDVEREDSKEYNIVMNILSEEAYRVISNSDLADYIIEIKNQQDTQYHIAL